MTTEQVTPTPGATLGPLARLRRNPRTAPAAAIVGTALVVVALVSSSARPEHVAQAGIDGVRFGLVIALSGVGLSLIFATTRLFNLAHGEFVTLGAVLAWVGNVELGLPLVLAGLLAVAVGAGAGAMAETGLWRPIRGRGVSLVNAMVVSIGLAMAARHVVLFFIGGQARPYDQYTVQQPWDVFGVNVLPKDVVSITVALATLGALGLFLRRSVAGQAIRATAADADLAASSGIATGRVIVVVWALGGALAALGGVLLALNDQVSWDMGFRALLLVIAGVTLGGLGTVSGAVVGGVIIGVITQLSTLWAPAELKYVFSLIVLVAILVLRPQGIFGHAERIG